MKFSGVTILQGVELSIFLLIFEWALQQCSATALPVIHTPKETEQIIYTFHCYYCFNAVKHSSYLLSGERSRLLQRRFRLFKLFIGCSLVDDIFRIEQYLEIGFLEKFISNKEDLVDNFKAVIRTLKL